VDPADTLDALAGLVDKSLVATSAHDRDPRYEMLETVRLYALEQLDLAGETAAARSLHRAFYLRLAETAEVHLTGADQGIWLGRLDVEHDNMRAALDSAIRQVDTGTALRLAGALWRFWYVRGHVGEGLAWIEAALGLPAEASPAERAKLLNAAGILSNVRRRLDEAADYHQQSLALRRRLGDRPGEAGSLSNLGIVALQRQDFDAARALFDESLQLRRELGDAWGQSTSLNNLGNVAYAQGDLPEARKLYQQALHLRRERADTHGVAGSLIDLANVAARESRYAEARSLYLESIGLLRELGDRAFLAYALEGLARVGKGEGRASYAARLLGASDALRERTGVAALGIWEQDYHDTVEGARTALGDQAFKAEWSAGRMMSLDEAIAYAATT
jgi:tetratricopeptide (TPR) repeat protein